MNYQEKIKILESLSTKEIIKYLEKDFCNCEDVLMQLEVDKVNIEYINRQENSNTTPKQYIINAAEFYYLWYWVIVIYTSVNI